MRTARSKGRRGRVGAWAFLVFWLWTAAAGAWGQVTYTTGTDPTIYPTVPCDIISWTDANGKTRTVWIINTSPGGFITHYYYYAGATLVQGSYGTAYPPMGLLGLCNHWNPGSSGTFNWSFAAADLAAPLTRTIAFQGANHLIWRGTLQLNSGGSAPFYNTIQYEFYNGRNDFTYTFTYDAGAMPASQILADNISPYGEFDFGGDGNSSNDPNSGVGWGTLWKFQTTSSPASSNSTWTYNQPNTIPYLWIWRDANIVAEGGVTTEAADREFGIVQNQPYKDQNAGGEVLNIANDGCLDPPSTGTGLSNDTVIPFQFNSYEDFAGGHFTWGSNYPISWYPSAFGNDETVFMEGHGEAYGQYYYGVSQNGFEQYPVNAWSFNVLIDQWSAGGVQALVTDTANAYASTLTASVGTVATTGPRGAGSYLAPGDTMPTVTYSTPGLDYVTRAWTLLAAGGQVNCTLAVPSGDTLTNPTFIFKNMPGLPCSLTLNGVPQVEGTDKFSSYDPSTSQVYVTFNKSFAAGANNLVVSTGCGSPTVTPTVTCTATSSATPTSTFSLTPSATASQTPTSSSTPTGTASPTASPTQTLTPTPTSTATAAFTPTFTATPVSTSTSTPTSTLSFTAVPTFSPTFTPSHTFTFTQTPTPTATASQTPTSSSTPTGTASPTVTLTITSTKTFTGTPTFTSTFTPSHFYTFTQTVTPTFTYTPTSTATPVSTSTSTPTSTLSFTALPTFTTTFTQTVTPTFTPTFTPTPISSPTFTQTISSGTTVTLRGPYPNPVAAGPVYVDILAPGPSGLKVDIFTTSFRKIASQSLILGGGKTTWTWDLRDKDGVKAADGLYYLRVQVSRAGQSSQQVLKLLILR